MLIYKTVCVRTITTFFVVSVVVCKGLKRLFFIIWLTKKIFNCAVGVPVKSVKLGKRKRDRLVGHFLLYQLNQVS